jgi:hypothetical protein
MKKSGDRSTPAASPVRQKTQSQQKAHLRNIEFAYNEAHTAAQGLTRAFGCSSQSEIPAIDAVIMKRLSTAFASIDDELQDACLQRGLLPRNIGESLRMARFLSITLPAARAAQKDTSVPASILIAEAHSISGPFFYGCSFELKRPDSSDIFNTGKSFKNLLEAFLQRAHWLKAQRVFQPVMRATGDRRIGLTSAAYPANFMELIADWSRPKYGDDLVATISEHDLLECDRVVPAL